MWREEDKGTFTSFRTIIDDEGRVFVSLFLDDFDHQRIIYLINIFFIELQFSHEQNLFSYVSNSLID